MRFVYTIVIAFCVLAQTLFSNDIDVSKLPKLLGTSNMGREFYMSFIPVWDNTDMSDLIIYVSSSIKTRVKVEVKEKGYEKIKYTIPNDIIEFTLAPALGQPYRKTDRDLPEPDQVWPGAAVHVVADDPIICYGVTSANYTSDGFLALPVHTLGKEYIAASYADPTDNKIQWLPSYIGIMAAYDKTKVRFTMGGTDWSTTGSGQRPGEVSNWNMNEGDVLLFGSLGAHAELTGSKIESTKPVGVVSGNFCAFIPTNCGCCDYITEMELPTATWGTEYHVTPIIERKKNSMIKIFAKEPKTEIYKDGSQIGFIRNAGGDSCGSEQCAVEVIWDLPDEDYGCYQLYIDENGDTLNFDTNSLPTLVSESCIDVGTYIEGSVTLLRFPEDPNPCVAEYEAYCPAGDLRQGCNPDSCQNSWKYDDYIKEIKSEPCKGDTLVVSYRYRNSCGNWQDLQILKMEIKSDSTLCTSTPDSLYQKAVERIIAEVDMGFDPSWQKISEEGGDTCSINWRISQISCWTHWMYDPTIHGIERSKQPKNQSDPSSPPILIAVYEPCNDICCARQLEVCRYGIDSVSIRDLGSLSEGEECDTVYWNNHECYDVCDFLEDFDQLDTLPKTPPIIYPKEDEITENGYGTSSIYNSIVVSYTNQFLKVVIDNLNANYTELSLFSITGSLLTSKSINLQKGINIFELDISRIQTGVYFYQISLDGLESQIGKLFIIR